MDYQAKPISRQDLRRLSRCFRKLFGVPEYGPFPVVEVLDRVGDVFKGSGYIVVADTELPPHTMAQCSANDMGGYTIEIGESVYMGAYRHIGAYRGFICHELCHVFLFSIGYTPIVARSFSDNVIPSYRSVEWQAKALCGEVMVPFKESTGMSQEDIITRYQVSRGFAIYRCRQNEINTK